MLQAQHSFCSRQAENKHDGLKLRTGGRGEIWADYDVRQGGLLGFGMLVLLFSAIIANRLRGSGRAHG